MNETCKGNCDVCTAARSASDVSIVVSAGNYGPSKTVCPAKAGLYGRAENVVSSGAIGSYSGSPDVIASDTFGFKPIDDINENEKTKEQDYDNSN